MRSSYSIRQRMNRMALAGIAAALSAGAVAHWALPGPQRGVVLAFLIGVAASLTAALFVFRRCVGKPLQRLIEEVEGASRIEPAKKLPMLDAREWRRLAAGFNRLIECVEEKRHHLREHIDRLERANAELNRLARFKDELLMTINHQLRTPLTAILEGIELMGEGALGPTRSDQRAVLAMVGENTQRLIALVEEALDLSLLNCSHRLLQRQPSDLAALLQRSCERWRLATETSRIRLSLSALPPAYMDASAVQEVLDHLLRNALRHASDGSEVLVRAQAREDVIEVSVRNEGSGLSDEQLKRLFQPFSHLQTPDSPGSQGSGLGLAFCREAIKRHRGVVGAESSAEGGTTIWFTLPAASPAFLFEEAFRCAKEDAEHERGQFGLLLAVPLLEDDDELTAAERLRSAKVLLRRSSHRGDRFVQLEDRGLAIFALTDAQGLASMTERLRGVIELSGERIGLSSALFPLDGTEPGRLLEAARRRLAQSHGTGLILTVASPSSAPATEQPPEQAGGGDVSHESLQRGDG